MDIINLFVLFILKHLVCDFFLQGPYQFLNKGKVGHPGGILHAAINGIGTMIVLAIGIPNCAFDFAFGFGIIEMSVHYVLDLYKVCTNDYYKWKPESSRNYWYSLGVDQTLHMLVYVIIVKQIVKGISLENLFTAGALIVVIAIIMLGVSYVLLPKKTLS